MCETWQFSLCMRPRVHQSRVTVLYCGRIYSHLWGLRARRQYKLQNTERELVTCALKFRKNEQHLRLRIQLKLHLCTIWA